MPPRFELCRATSWQCSRNITPEERFVHAHIIWMYSLAGSPLQSSHPTQLPPAQHGVTPHDAHIFQFLHNTNWHRRIYSSTRITRWWCRCVESRDLRNYRECILVAWCKHFTRVRSHLLLCAGSYSDPLSYPNRTLSHHMKHGRRLVCFKPQRISSCLSLYVMCWLLR